ncbi:MAG TPA: hypothetical protein VFU21_22755 [Kofleriaceae bacterium]|nr:hypothetical protein [Kofleriaceae bacterium]
MVVTKLLARSGGLLATVTLVAVAACSFDTAASSGRRDGSADPDGRPGDDGGGGGDAGEVCSTWDPAAPFEPCEISPRGGDLELLEDGTYLYDTTSDQLTFEGGDEIPHDSQLIAGDTIRVLSARHLEVGALAKLRVTGTLPLILVVWDRADLLGTLDVSSSEVASDGAGANPDVCADTGARPGGGGVGVTGAGGGGGGAFGGDGGDGGFGGGALPGTGGTGGSAFTGDPGLRGGCPGGRGGVVGAGGPGAGRGSGGGAVAVSARLVLAVEGVIHAGGGGGLGAVSDLSGGGGGGGSGGLIWLDAPDIQLADAAVLAANGGGGGEGADNNDAGDPGDPARASRTSAPGGSSGGNDGGNGGAGSDLDTPGGTMAGSGGNNAGGGGGGGGAGIIRFDGTVTDDGATLSPPATPFE